MTRSMRKDVFYLMIGIEIFGILTLYFFQAGYDMPVLIFNIAWFIPTVICGLSVRYQKPKSDVSVLRVELTGALVLVICPYCSIKVEQGITVCTNCGAKL